jgi:hypothetical protein
VKHFSLLLALCFCATLLLCCQQIISPKIEGGIEGQIYEIGSPAVPPGWTPPPLRGIRTIVISDSSKVGLQLLATDSLGAFKMSLQAGTYFLLVKDTIRPQGQNGPFVVAADQIISVKVYHDNGMR